MSKPDPKALTLEDLIPAMCRSLQNFIDLVEIGKRKVQEQVEPFIGKREAAEFLNMSVKTLERRMAMSEGPPRYIDGGKISFLRSELKVWRRQWRAGDQTGLE